MPDVSLDLRYLRYAIAAAEHGSFRKAAICLDVPQSTVSRRILTLEDRLGFPLFVRDRRGVKLTIAGADFLANAVAGVQQLSRAAQLAAATHKGQRGVLRVGILASLTTGFLHCVLRRFRELQPHLQIILQEGTSLETLHALSTGRLDISFVTGQHDMRGYHSKVLWNESVYVVLPEKHWLAGQELVSWDELRDENFIVSHGGPGSEIQDYLIRMLSRSGFRPRIDVHDVSRENLLNLVSMGYGLTLTSTSSLRRDVEGVFFRPIAGERDVLASSAVWSAGNVNPALRHLLSVAEGIAKEWTAKMGGATASLFIMLAYGAVCGPIAFPGAHAQILDPFL